MRILLAILLAASAFAQTQPAGPVIGMNNFVFGLPKPLPPRPPNAAVPVLINAPGAQLQVQVFRIQAASRSSYSSPRSESDNIAVAVSLSV
jgi:hypothetical protein